MRRSRRVAATRRAPGRASFLKSIRSGPFSWMKSAERAAACMSASNVRRDCDGSRPNRSR
jgi:hypothetical protein